MPVLLQPSLSANENSSYLRRTAARPAATAGPNATPTSVQVGFIRTLLADRDTSDADRALQGLLDAFSEQTITRGNASKLIDALKRLPWKTRPVQTAIPVPEQPAAPRTEPVEEGYYRMGGAFYQVKTSRSTNRKYALLWDGARWDYEGAKGVYRQLTPAMVLTAEDAKAFGDQHHACVFCLQALTDQRSIDAGYGPVCAGHRGLPWG